MCVTILVRPLRLQLLLLLKNVDDRSTSVFDRLGGQKRSRRDARGKGGSGRRTTDRLHRTHDGKCVVVSGSILLLPLRPVLTLPQGDGTGDLIQRHEPATAKRKR
jgi:hypothetical protein